MRYYLTVTLALALSGAVFAQPDTWRMPDSVYQYKPDGLSRPFRSDKKVGLFYFLTNGAHGYDHQRTPLPDEGVMEKEAGDTLSPYNISEMLTKDSAHPAYGPVFASHHWGEPYFGYYLANDEWVIRKHAQLLSDAGIDVLIMDVTNAFIYFPQFSLLANTFAAIRKEGKPAPEFCFILNTKIEKTADRLYDSIYSRGRWKDQWFQWKGKPLLLANPDSLPAALCQFFTVRQSWAWSKGEAWFGNGKDKWTWVDHSPQHFGWHEDSTRPEQVSVSAAEHPFSNIGRSFHDGQEPTVKQSGKGFFFAEQWKHALEIDPEFLFITGWNEWTAMRFNQSNRIMFLGRRMTRGETYFVDQYNDEFSRDIEPMRGGFEDHYYYQMVEGIRKFKGVHALPVYHDRHTIRIDGRYGDWDPVTAVYTDDRDDIPVRHHAGYGRIGSYDNTSGRNDLIEAKVACDENTVSFMARTAQPLSPAADSNWMVLYLRTGRPGKHHWMGYSFRVNQWRSGGKASLEYNTGGYTWRRLATVPIAVSGDRLELQIPLRLLGLSAANMAIDLKWADNVPADGNPLHWLDRGDAAPNAAFSYSYRFTR